MKEEILTHQQDAKQLEKLYRGDKNLFKREFASLYPQLAGTPLADFWQERLHYESEDISWGPGRAGLVLFFSGFFCGVI
jgi:hypothetical protein